MFSDNENLKNNIKKKKKCRGYFAKDIDYASLYPTQIKLLNKYCEYLKKYKDSFVKDDLTDI